MARAAKTSGPPPTQADVRQQRRQWPAWLAGRWAWRSTGILVALFAILFVVPWQPVASASIGAFDYSLYYTLHDAAAQGWQFGRDIIVPQGPLGFLGTGVYHPRTYAALVIGRTLMALVGAWALWHVGRRLVPHPLLALPWAVAILALVGRSPDHFFPGCAILMLVTYFVVDERRRPGATVYVLAAVLAAASLFKVSQPLYAAVTLGSITLDRAARRDRWFSAVPLAYLACLAVLYVAAGQSPGSLAAFARGWLNILRGHGDAVGLAGPVVDAAAYLFAAAGVLAVIIAVAWKGGGRLATLLLAAGTAGVLLLLYKHSFTRQDFWHANMGPMVATGAGLLILPVAWRAGGRYLRAGSLASVALASAVTGSILASYNGEGLTGYAGVVATRCGENGAAAVRLVTDHGRLWREWDAHRAHVRAEVPLRLDDATRTATVDVYPHRQDVVYAYGLNYAPRPAISSLMATSPVLAELNAEHLRGPSAPQVVLFDVELVDRNYPTMLDGLSLPELLTRYDVADDAGNMLVLRKAAAPRAYRLTPVSTQVGRLDQPITIPSDGVPAAPIWARISVKETFAGRVLGMLYKPVMIGIEVRTRDGASESYRFLPGIADRHGFLLSPLIKDRPAYARLASTARGGELNGAAVTSMTIFVADGSQAMSLEPEFEIELQRLEFGRQD